MHQAHTLAADAKAYQVKEKKRIEAALLLYGLEDMLHLGWMVQSTSVVTGKKRQDPEVFDLTIGAIRELLEAGFARVGDSVADDRGMASVDYWDPSPDAAIAEIKDRWKKHDELDRQFVVWLELTEMGRQEAERLDAAGCDPFKK